MLKFTINDFLELRLEDGKTNIYVNDELFIHCKYLLLNVPVNDIEISQECKSIDDAVEKLDNSFEFKDNIEIEVPPEVQFWGHCSNLQAWYENNYNCSLIHSNLAFPLLKQLTKSGDFLAGKVFKHEIAKRFEKGHLGIIQFFLYYGYLDFFNGEELELLLEVSTANLINNLTNQFKKYMESTLDNYRNIKGLMELVFFIDLKYNKNFIIKIFENLAEKAKDTFIRLAILHLNYKEFRNYKIPYGRFYYYFEQIVDFLYDRYPCIDELVKLLDSGFYNAGISLDEKLSYGTVSYNKNV